MYNMFMYTILILTSNSFNASFNMAPGSREPIFNTFTEAATYNTQDINRNLIVKHPPTYLGLSAEIHKNIY